MTTLQQNFTTCTDLDVLVDNYLTVRRALGYKLHEAESILRRFLTYLTDHHADTITVADAVGFATAPPLRTPRTQALRLSAIRGFTTWAQYQRPDIEVPPARILPARPSRLAPFIYTRTQIQALLDAASELTPVFTATTYRTLISLMASTGIRTGEARGLDLSSLNPERGLLTITGKYGKTRILPLHATVVDGLTDYINHRGDIPAADSQSALLVSTRGNRLPASSVNAVFRKIADRAGLTATSTSCRPRLHDLRHTFAVSTMLDAYRRGDDPAVTLPILSTWLGHTEPSDTYWYLTGTTELLDAATAKLIAGDADNGLADDCDRGLA